MEVTRQDRLGHANVPGRAPQPYELMLSDALAEALEVFRDVTDGPRGVGVAKREREPSSSLATSEPSSSQTSSSRP